MDMRLSVDHGLQVMDITKAVSLRLRIIKIEITVYLKMQAFEEGQKHKLPSKKIDILY